MSEAARAIVGAGEVLRSLHQLLHSSCIGALPEYEDVQLSRVRCGLARVCGEIAPVQNALIDLAGCMENWCSNPSKLYWKQSSSALMALQAKHAAALKAVQHVWLETRSVHEVSCTQPDRFQACSSQITCVACWIHYHNTILMGHFGTCAQQSVLDIRTWPFSCHHLCAHRTAHAALDFNHAGFQRVAPMAAA